MANDKRKELPNNALTVRNRAKKLVVQLKATKEHLDALGLLDTRWAYVMDEEVARLQDIVDECTFTLRAAQCRVNEFSAVTRAARLLSQQELVEHPGDHYAFMERCEQLWRVAVMEESEAMRELHEVQAPRPVC